MTDDAMRAARDRWLADPESAGTGKAFEAGWSARDGETLSLRNSAAAFEGVVRDLEGELERERARRKAMREALAGILSAAGKDGRDIGPAFGWWVYKLAQKVIAADQPPPTGEVNTGEDC